MSSSTELHWFKSSYSGGSGDSCVEVAGGSGAVHVRDSKTFDSPRLGFAPLAWASFVDFAASSASVGVR